MNTNAKISVDQLIFRNLYYRYQSFIAPMATIFVSLLLFWFVVIPQMQSWFQMRDSLTVDTQNLQILHQNLSLLVGLDDTKLTQMLSTATTALPAEKDFAGIIASIQNAANISGANLGDYAFQLGDLSGLDPNGKVSQLPVQLNVILKGNMADAQRFATQLKKQLPLSDTIALAVSGDQSITVTVVFYYASLPKIVFQDTQPLPVLGAADMQLLNALLSGNDLQNATIASPSSTLSPKLTVTPSLSPTPIATSTAAPTPIATSSAQ